MNKLQEMFIKDSPESISETDNIKALSTEVLKMQALENDIESDEKKLKDKKEKLRQISGEIIPTMMSEMSLSELKLKDGSEISIKDIFGVSIIAAKKQEAHNWLRKNGLGSIVKNEITVKFGLNEDNKAEQYASLARGQGYDPDRKVTVHAGTLRTTLRDYHERGGSIPAELFNTFEGNQTEIKTK